MLQSEIEFNTAENEPSACWQYFKVANANVQQLAVGEVTFLAEEQKQVLRHMNRALQGQIFQGPRISVKTMSGKCEAEKRFFWIIMSLFNVKKKSFILFYVVNRSIIES